VRQSLDVYNSFAKPLHAHTHNADKKQQESDDIQCPHWKAGDMRHVGSGHNTDPTNAESEVDPEIGFWFIGHIFFCFLNAFK
jgi:hypothetical protein